MKRTVFVAIALFVAPLFAAAQTQTPDDTWWARVAEQNAINVASSKANIQAQALKNTIYFATFYRGRMDLADSVAPIRSMCDKGAKGELRALALAALQTVGSFEALDYLDHYATADEVKNASALIAEVIAERHQARLSASL